MARPPGSYQHDEDLEEDEKPCYGEDFIHYHDSFSHKAGAGKMDGKRGSVNDRRTKHSETEQRRRSKINERQELFVF
ncbi:hypothetical protein SAY86_030042 [Trapa natans]|uniref:Uncharacterized protein n=1 Tax=Trapa natans TaxID=22666 RepID=A0AAN7RGR3_TRANT|nr:hypothetical protein SAY86_030042 [Trapa natans]